ncbi:hypothetical protein ACQY0O_007677 [Thecaphora frezii]
MGIQSKIQTFGDADLKVGREAKGAVGVASALEQAVGFSEQPAAIAGDNSAAAEFKASEADETSAGRGGDAVASEPESKAEPTTPTAAATAATAATAAVPTVASTTTTPTATTTTAASTSTVTADKGANANVDVNANANVDVNANANVDVNANANASASVSSGPTVKPRFSAYEPRSELLRLRLTGSCVPETKLRQRLPLSADLGSEDFSRATIFIAGIEAENALWNFLNQFSPVLSLKLVKDLHLRCIKHVFADFESEAEALKVVKLIPVTLFRSYRLRAEMARGDRTVNFCSRSKINYPSVLEQAELTPSEREFLLNLKWPHAQVTLDCLSVKWLGAAFGPVEQVKAIFAQEDERIYEAIFERREDAQRAAEAYRSIPISSKLIVRYKQQPRPAELFGVISSTGGCRMPGMHAIEYPTRPTPPNGGAGSMRRNRSHKSTGGSSGGTSSVAPSVPYSVPHSVPASGPPSAPDLSVPSPTHDCIVRSAKHLCGASDGSLASTDVSGLTVATPKSQDRLGDSDASSRTRLSNDLSDSETKRMPPTSGWPDPSPKPQEPAHSSLQASSLITQHVDISPETLSWADQISEELEERAAGVTAVPAEKAQGGKAMVAAPWEKENKSKIQPRWPRYTVEELKTERQASLPPHYRDRPRTIEKLLPRPPPQPKKAPLLVSTSASYDPRIDAFSIWVGNLPFDTTDTVLRDLFCKYGKVVNVQIHHTFAFIKYETKEAAALAIEKENGENYREGTIIVRAKETRMTAKRMTSKLFAGHRPSQGRPPSDRGHNSDNRVGAATRSNAPCPSAASRSHPLPAAPNVDYNLTLNRFVAAHAQDPHKTRLYRGPLDNRDPTSPLKGSETMAPHFSSANQTAKGVGNDARSQFLLSQQQHQQQHQQQQQSFFAFQPQFPAPSGAFMMAPQAYGGPWPPPLVPAGQHCAAAANGKQALTVGQPSCSSVNAVGQPAVAQPMRQPDSKATSPSENGSQQKPPTAYTVAAAAVTGEIEPPCPQVDAVTPPSDAGPASALSEGTATVAAEAAHRDEHATMQESGNADPMPMTGTQARGPGHGRYASAASGASPNGIPVPMHSMPHFVAWTGHPAGATYHVPFWHPTAPQLGQSTLYHFASGPPLMVGPPASKADARALGAPPSPRHGDRVPAGAPFPWVAAYGPMQSMAVGLPYFGGHPMQMPVPMSIPMQPPASSQGTTSPATVGRRSGFGRRERSDTTGSLRSSVGPGPTVSCDGSNRPVSPTPFSEYGDYGATYGPGQIEMIEVPSYAADA